MGYKPKEINIKKLKVYLKKTKQNARKNRHRSI